MKLWKRIDQLSGKEQDRSESMELNINSGPTMTIRSHTVLKDSLEVTTSLNNYFIDSVSELIKNIF